MPKLINLTGKKFGELTVLKRAENSKKGKIQWLVRCSCGKEVIKPGNHLKDSRFCRRGGHARLGTGKAAFNHVIRTYKRNAERRNLEWNLSEQEVFDISQRPCSYCGNPPDHIIKASTYKVIGDFIYSGLDRVDNTKGYIAGNVVPCCQSCNWMKKDFTFREFRNHINKIHSHLSKSLSD